MATDSQLSEADILGAVIAPNEPTLPVEAARTILDLRFNDAAVARINELLEKNRQDTISQEERAVLDKFLRVGQFLNLMQAKARASLANGGS